jgi:hypothetical protein
MKDVLFGIRLFKFLKKVCILVLKGFVQPFEMFELFVELKIVFGHECNFLMKFFIFGFGLFKFFLGIVLVIL